MNIVEFQNIVRATHQFESSMPLATTKILEYKIGNESLHELNNDRGFDFHEHHEVSKLTVSELFVMPMALKEGHIGGPAGPRDLETARNLKDFKTKILPNPNNSPILPPSLPPPPSRSDPISRQKSQNQSLRLKKEYYSIS
ncbi:hypothetical protein Peur_033973 [Populus x canadensis]